MLLSGHGFASGGGPGPAPPDGAGLSVCDRCGRLVPAPDGPPPDRCPCCWSTGLFRLVPAGGAAGDRRRHGGHDHAWPDGAAGDRRAVLIHIDHAVTACVCGRVLSGGPRGGRAAARCHDGPSVRCPPPVRLALLVPLPGGPIELYALPSGFLRGEVPRH